MHAIVYRFLFTPRSGRTILFSHMGLASLAAVTGFPLI